MPSGRALTHKGRKNNLHGQPLDQVHGRIVHGKIFCISPQNPDYNPSGSHKLLDNSCYTVTNFKTGIILQFYLLLRLRFDKEAKNPHTLVKSQARVKGHGISLELGQGC